jgi:hypothetical protein
LKPVGQDPYYELHVTPENQRSQFRFAQAECAREIINANPDKSTTELFSVDDPIFESKTKIITDQNKWYTLAAINPQSMIESNDNRIVNCFFYNFCRKNIFESGREEYSSTAELSEFNYHHQNEWGTLSLPKFAGKEWRSESHYNCLITS